MGGPSLLSLAIGLGVLSAVFWLIERWRPAPRLARRMSDTRTHIAYWFFTPLVTHAATRVGVAMVFVAIAAWRGVSLADLQHLASTRRTWAASLPIAVQVPLILLVADLLAYGTHRLFHARWLWPFHAIHHSATRVDWLSSVRLHPVNDLLSRIAQVVPLYWMGFNGTAPVLRCRE